MRNKPLQHHSVQYHIQYLPLRSSWQSHLRGLWSQERKWLWDICLHNSLHHLRHGRLQTGPRSYCHSPQLPWLHCPLPTLQGQGWRQHIPHIWYLIWQSVTLQGRGTWVFGATKEDNPNLKACNHLVLKNAWREFGHLPESTLYGIINRLQEGDDMLSLRCVAKFVNGRDVMVKAEIMQYPDICSEIKGDVINQRVLMRVSSHWKLVEGAESNPHNPPLHHVMLATCGKSMELYTSLIELLSAAECATEGMRSILSQQARHSHSPKVSSPSVSLGSIIGMLVLVTSFSAQTWRSQQDLFPILISLQSVKKQSRWHISETTAQ